MTRNGQSKPDSPVHSPEKFLGIEHKTFIETVGILERAGALLRRGRSLRIIPNVLSEHILYNACLTEGENSTGYAQDIFDAFKDICPTNVLHNLSALDWKIRSSRGQDMDLVRDILESLKVEFEGTSNFERIQLLRIIREIAYYQPDYALEIIQKIVDRRIAIKDDSDFPYSSLLREVPGIIEQISYTLDYVPICCDLLWSIGRDDENGLYNNPPDSIMVLLDLPCLIPCC